MKTSNYKSILKIACLLFLCFISSSVAQGRVDKSLYPHWNHQHPHSQVLLEKLETFIAHNIGQKKVVVFDWDGTLYNENVVVKEHSNAVRSGQSAWHLWAAANMGEQEYLYPMFRLDSCEASRYFLTSYDDYLEGVCQEKPQEYSKFRQIACLEAGMSVCEFNKGVRLFLKDSAYKVGTHAYRPMLDIMQRFADNDYIIYIITGSNPYYVETLLDAIQEEIPYTSEKRYDFGIISKTHSRIIGNCAKLGKNQRFTMIYDERFVKNKNKESYVIDREGKTIAIQRFLQEEHRLDRPIFVGGNSGGDVSMIKYCVNMNDFPNTWGLAVTPRGELLNIYDKYGLGLIQESMLR